MAKCKVCNTSSDDELCSEVCITIIEDTKERILRQKSLFDTIVNNDVELRCKECGGKRKKYTQYCTKCARDREIARKRAYELKRRKKRYCKNEDCKKELIPPVAKNQKYCCNECKPNHNRSEKKRLHDLDRAEKLRLERANYDKYKGTVPSKWIQPRGSKKRKEMGLEVSRFGLSKDSDTGGRFVY